MSGLLFYLHAYFASTNDDDDGGMKNWKRAENSPREIFASVRARVGRGILASRPFPPFSAPLLADVAKENGAISAQAIDLILMTDAVLTRQQSRLSPP